MYILGIETSCDETAAAVLSHEFEVLSNVVLSQDKIHAPYGGIVPELASRQHIRSISLVVHESLQRAGLDLPAVDVFAVTQGPGLIGSLLVGLSFAKGLAYFFSKPLVAVDHLQSHIFSVCIENRDIPLPALALLASGGHTSLILMKGRLDFKIVARTRDDAAGEALDKIAKYMNIGYPGGPIIDRLADTGDPNAFPFSLPQMTDGSLDYSFSGLKTAALQIIRKHGLTDKHPRFRDFVASFEGAVLRALMSNLIRAVKDIRPRSVVLCGGVARNRKLRTDFEESARRLGLPGFIPSPEYCTDNAAMVAALAAEKMRDVTADHPLLDLNAYPRTSF